jgi:hypothetical protein
MSTDDKFGDSRLKKSAGADVRGSRDFADVDRVQNDGGSLTAEQRRKQLRNEWVQEVLPTVKAPEGWHFCWLSTTNSTDPIHKRMQMGYLPVKASEVPGFTASQYKVTGGDFDGCIACNEMLLFKVTAERYNDLMTIYHADMPAEQEQSIKERIMGIDERDSTGRGLVSSEGFDRLGRGNQPHFA